MDTKISENGDLARRTDGRPFHITGLDEIRQRIYIRLSAHKGRFIYDRTLGSGIFETDTESGNALTEIEAQARDALAGIPQAEVTGAEINNGAVTVHVSYCGEELEIVPRS